MVSIDKKRSKQLTQETTGQEERDKEQGELTTNGKKEENLAGLVGGYCCRSNEKEEDERTVREKKTG